MYTIYRKTSSEMEEYYSNINENDCGIYFTFRIDCAKEYTFEIDALNVAEKLSVLNNTNYNVKYIEG